MVDPREIAWNAGEVKAAWYMSEFRIFHCISPSSKLCGNVQVCVVDVRVQNFPLHISLLKVVW